MEERRKNTCPLKEEHDSLKRVMFGDKTTEEDGLVKKMEDMHTSIIKIENFMENLSGINNISVGITLLKKPTLWILAFVIGIVALVGGLKTLMGWFFIMK